jgi:predicted DNA-binding transcriptional regulator YafY
MESGPGVPQTQKPSRGLEPRAPSLTRFEVEVTVHAPAERVAREVGERGSVEALDADASRLRMRIDDLSWAARTLAAIDADFEVHQPAELDHYLRRVGRRFTASVRRRR